jgi:hypothetical protein
MNRIFLGYGLRQKSDFLKKSDFFGLWAPSKIRFFEKIGFFWVMGSVKNPIPQYFGTGFFCNFFLNQ